jgi:hypothetical protein
MQDGDRPQPASRGPSRLSQDLLAGVLFVILGAGILWTGRALPIGTAAEMGSGYVPRLLAFLLIGLGFLVGLSGIRGGGRRLPSLTWRAPGLVTGAVVLFLLLIERAGLFLSVAGVVILSGLATEGLRFRTLIGIALALAGFCAAVFAWALRLPVRVWPL